MTEESAAFQQRVQQARNTGVSDSKAKQAAMREAHAARVARPQQHPATGRFVPKRGGRRGA
jgi:hypothetical protein